MSPLPEGYKACRDRFLLGLLVCLRTSVRHLRTDVDGAVLQLLRRFLIIGIYPSTFSHQHFGSVDTQIL